MFRLVMATLLAGLGLTLSACFAEAIHPMTSKGQDITGDWEGTSTSYPREGNVNIRMRVFQAGDKFSGTYACEAGDIFCRNMIHSGSLSGKTGATAFKVNLEDNSWCKFSGDFAEHNAGGHYVCYYHGGIVDIGSWKLKLHDWQREPLPPLPAERPL